MKRRVVVRGVNGQTALLQSGHAVGLKGQGEVVQHRRHVGPCEASDLRTYHPDERRDLTAGGVPCQPFSAAGLGLGLDDPRYLVPDFLRIAREAGSRAVMLENVRGLYTHDNGRTFAEIKRVLTEELGYSLFEFVVRASD